MHRRSLATVAVLAAPLALAGAAAAHIRLAGEFAMSGRITAAHAVPGERVGESVTRTWVLVPLCPAGQCQTELLVRTRATGFDELKLHRKAGVFDRWTGKGSFFAPLECRSRIYRHGEDVFFTVEVRIAAAMLFDGLPFATELEAGYTSYRQTNRTPCVSVVGHDAAVYTGKLVIPGPTPAPPAGTPAPY